MKLLGFSSHVQAILFFVFLREGVEEYNKNFSLKNTDKQINKGITFEMSRIFIDFDILDRFFWFFFFCLSLGLDVSFLHKNRLNDEIKWYWECS